MQKRHFISLLTFMLLATLPCSAAKADLRQDLAAGRARHAALKEKADNLNEDIAKIRDDLLDAASGLRKTEEDLSQQQQRLKDVRAERENAVKALWKTQQNLGSVVGAARRYQSQSMPVHLLTTTPLQAAQSAFVLKSIVPVLHQQGQTLEVQVQHLHQLEQTVLEQQRKTEDKRLDYQNRQARLKDLLMARQVIYKRTENDRRSQEQAVRRLAAKARDLDDLVTKIQTPAKTISNYRLPTRALTPINGRVLIGFNETDGLGARSRGVTFRGSAGSTVITPLAGTVKFAGPFQNYKQILIIAHRGGYHSLIAGLGRINTVVGASLSAGEPVGTTTSSSTDAQIYYELRKNGAPVDPQKLLAASNKQDKS